MSRPHPIRIAGLALLLPAVLLTAPACASTNVREHGFGAVTAQRVSDYSQHIHVLASEYMEGRLPGTPGIERAASYIEWNFQNLGLEPAFKGSVIAADGQEVLTDNTSYRQTFQIGDIARLGRQSLALTIDARSQTLAGGDDYNALAYGNSGTVTAPVTFVGYSIPAGPRGYEGYPEGTDLTGQAALILRYEPMNERGRSLWMDRGWSFAATLGPKFRAAVNRGASAVILVTPPGALDETDRILETIETSGQGQPVSIPVIHVTPEIAERMVRAGDPEGRSLADLIALANRGSVIVPLEGVTAEIDCVIERDPVLTDNIGAILPGKGHLADEYVVVGAHYDHLGMASFGTRYPGRMHPGADDNASGTAGMLTAAGMLAEAWPDIEGPVRSVLFLAFSAEESGLNGSAHYVEHPIVPIEKHTFMLNMDMIGSLRNHLEAGGVGSGEGLAELAGPIFDRSGVDVRTSLSVGAGRSDHANFDRKGVPNIFLFTGLTDQYHTPDDTIKHINIEGASLVAGLGADLALAAAIRETPLLFVRTGSDDSGRRRMGGPGGVRVRVGIAPGDYSGRVEGVQIARVFDGTSAADAGLQEGDLITVWNGEPVKNVEDWMPLLATHQPGDTIDVVIIRDGKEITIPMTLKPRQSRGE